MLIPFRVTNISSDWLAGRLDLKQHSMMPCFLLHWSLCSNDRLKLFPAKCSHTNIIIQTFPGIYILCILFIYCKALAIAWPQRHSKLLPNVCSDLLKPFPAKWKHQQRKYQNVPPQYLKRPLTYFPQLPTRWSKLFTNGTIRKYPSSHSIPIDTSFYIKRKHDPEQE